MEACSGSGSHHIGGRSIVLGHDVRLIPAQYIKPFLKGHKNDYRDAEAIAEAVQRPTERACSKIRSAVGAKRTWVGRQTGCIG